MDYARLNSDSIFECYRLEYETLKRITPDIAVTTNLMETYEPLDYFAWAPHLDVISWDSYPPMQASPWDIALRHDLMRGLKEGQPFMLMEQTPNQQNWQAYNSLKRPGVLRLWSYQAMAHGADAIVHFQLRRSRGACEKWHGAVISHAGHENTLVFRESAELGKELKDLGESVLAPIDGVEVTQRKNGDKILTFLLNHNADPVKVDVTPVAGRELLSGRQMSAPAELPGRGVWIIEKGG